MTKRPATNDIDQAMGSDTDPPAPSTPKKTPAHGVGRASASPSKLTPTKKIKKDEGNGVLASPDTKGKGWNELERAVFFKDVLRQYKPDWDFINTELSLVADQLGQQPRTRKAATRFYDNQIKAELLAKAMVDKVPKVVVERET